jgi:hypothetical protein
MPALKQLHHPNGRPELSGTDHTHPPHVSVVGERHFLERPFRVTENFITEVPEELISPIDTSKPLCANCSDIKLSELAADDALLVSDSYAKLKASAATCPLCAMVYNSIQMRGRYIPAGGSGILLRAYDDGSAASGYGNGIAHVEALYLCREPELQPGEQFVANSWVVGETEVNRRPFLTVVGKPMALVAEAGMSTCCRSIDFLF